MKWGVLGKSSQVALFVYWQYSNMLVWFTPSWDYGTELPKFRKRRRIDGGQTAIREQEAQQTQLMGREEEVLPVSQWGSPNLRYWFSTAAHPSSHDSLRCTCSVRVNLEPPRFAQPPPRCPRHTPQRADRVGPTDHRATPPRSPRRSRNRPSPPTLPLLVNQPRRRLDPSGAPPAPSAPAWSTPSSSPSSGAARSGR